MPRNDGYAYSAKAPDPPVPPDIPSGWPEDFPYPGPTVTDGAEVPLPPGFPTPAPPGVLTLPVTVDTLVQVDVPLNVEATVKDAGLDSDILEFHILRLSATNTLSAIVPIRLEPSDPYVNFLDLFVTNYSGSKYGIQDTILCFLEDTPGATLVTITATIVSISPNLVGSDTALSDPCVISEQSNPKPLSLTKTSPGTDDSYSLQKHVHAFENVGSQHYRKLLMVTGTTTINGVLRGTITPSFAE